MTYVRDERDLTACPACGSGRLVCVLGVQFDGCCECLKFWERLPAGEPYTVDGEQLPFRIPCDNCAFRGKSQERLDKDGWEALMYSLVHGGEFFCHKAVPFDPKDHRQKGYEFPRIPLTADLAGETVPYQGYDRERMRYCRGWLNRFVVGKGAA